MRAATRARIEIQTTRGSLEFQMKEQAPLLAVQITRLARQGFYNGLTFHRVVPGFVAQGGDPRGDGFGGPGYLVRDEVSMLEHDRGTVALASGGKDTGGSQFFINLAPNHHLDGKYSVIAEVTRGMDIADKLEPGDKILSARVLP
ncbi:peptidylprolyl isomerase [bacterium]|nr:peptidylprolyl isomerase [bacterium]